MNAIKLGKFLAQVRNEKGYTQDVLAEKLNVDSKKVSRWECGNSIPDFETLIDISKVLDVTLYEMSICERINDKTLLDKTRDKFKTLRDYKMMKLRKKVIYFIAILLGILFGLTTLYTIEYYGKVEVYGFRSIDNEYSITGNYIKAKDYEVINVTNVSYIGEKLENGDTFVRNIHFQLLNNNEFVITELNNESLVLDKDYIKLKDIFQLISLKDEDLGLLIPVNDDLIFKITYEDNKLQKNSVLIKFKLSKKFDNKF